MKQHVHSPSKTMQSLRLRQKRLEAYYRENNIDKGLVSGDLIRLFALVSLSDSVVVFQNTDDGAFHRERFRPLARHLFGHVRQAVERLTHLVIGSSLFVTDIQDGVLQSFRLPRKGKADEGKIDVRQRLIDWSHADSHEGENGRQPRPNGLVVSAGK